MNDQLQSGTNHKNNVFYLNRIAKLVYRNQFRWKSYNSKLWLNSIFLHHCFSLLNFFDIIQMVSHQLCLKQNSSCGKPKIKEDDLDITQFYRAYNYLYCTFALDKYVLFLRCLFPTTPLVHLSNCTCIISG